jgi:hypothetical protein
MTPVHLFRKRPVWLMGVAALGIVWAITSLVGDPEVLLGLAGIFGMAEGLWVAAVFPDTIRSWKGLAGGTILAVLPLYSIGTPLWYLLCRWVPGYQPGVGSCRFSAIVVGTTFSVSFALFGILAMCFPMFLEYRRMKRLVTKGENDK